MSVFRCYNDVLTRRGTAEFQRLKLC